MNETSLEVPLVETSKVSSPFSALQGDSLLFRMEGGISIIENPTFRFQYLDNGSRSIQVRAMDTDGNLFQKEIIKQLF